MTFSFDERTFSETLSGKTRRPEDAAGKKTLFGLILRSPVSRGQIKRILLPQIPKNTVVVDSKDVPGTNEITLEDFRIPILTGRDITWEGQPILLVAAPNEDDLRDWMSRVELDIKVLEGAEPFPPPERDMRKGDPGSAFSHADRVVETNIEISPGSIESGESEVICRKEGRVYILHLATDWPAAVQGAVAQTMGVNRDQVKIHPYRITPNSAGGLWRPALAASRAALLAGKARRSVRLYSGPHETAKYESTLPGAKFLMKAALDPAGKVLALNIEFTLHIGAKMPLSDELLDRVCMSVMGVYPCKNFHIRGFIAADHSAPVDFGPAGGLELGFFAAEILASRIAAASHSPSRLWRTSHLPAKGQSSGPGIVSRREPHLQELIQRAAVLADFDRKQAAYTQNTIVRKPLSGLVRETKGIGMSCAWFGSGFSSFKKNLSAASLSVRLNKKGELRITIPVGPSQMGLLRDWMRIAGDILGLEEKDIGFVPGMPDNRSEPGPSTLGRNVGTYTHLLELACRELAKRRFRDPLPIEVVKSHRRLPGRTWDPSRLSGTPYEGLSWGVGIVEVAVSMETFLPRILHVWLCLDAGRLINPALADSAVKTQTMQALAYAFGGTSASQGGRGFSPRPPFPCSVEFRQAAKKDLFRGGVSLPWVLVPAALLQALEQGLGKTLSRLPIRSVDLG